ncbi:hypothetical protein AAV01_14380 [Listeria monocytogenes]|nr:hypothetical protein [Listeria monocytogenes]EAC6741592.1 hypothetical protein [Listeria monocytogenes]HAC3413665.1 hypothetical protein [Listeria monocytogenes]
MKKIFLYLVLLIVMIISFFYSYFFIVDTTLIKLNVLKVEFEHMRIFRLSKVILCEIIAFFSTAILFVFAIYVKEMKKKKVLYINPEILECKK